MTRIVRETSSIGGSLGGPPKSCELELSVFGPGYGESILVHLGNEEWMVVDSCINPNSRISAPLEYLHGIGVNPSKAIKLIVATHWHDDHIRGLGSVVSESKAAQFICSSALRKPEFLTLVHAYGKQSMMETSGIQEFYKIINIMQTHQSSQAPVSPKFAIAERLLWQRAPTISGDHMGRWISTLAKRFFKRLTFSTCSFILPCQVHALSPSDVSLNLAFSEIASLLPSARATKRRIVAQSPNHAAVVLFVKIGAVSILLGSDLEETTNPNAGWSAIVDSTTRPLEKASLIKVPHHGSANADNPRVWDEMLEKEPIAVLSPFVSGAVILPTKTDTLRICRRTDKSYSTAAARPGGRIRRDKTVEKTIKETVRSIKPMYGPWGHVRIRTDIKMSNNREWNVEFFGDALPLREMYG